MIRSIAIHDKPLLDANAPAAVPLPHRVHLLPSGSFYGRDGRGPYRVAAADALIEASMAAGPLIIDVGHATDKGIPEAPAYGRIHALEADDEGIWGRVLWNRRGRMALIEREYWGISPVFLHSPSGAVLQILRAALTNIPNLRLAALNAQQESGMEKQERLPPTLPPPAPAADDLQAENEALRARIVTLEAKIATATAVAAVETALRTRRAAPSERESLMGIFAALGAEKFAAAMAARPELLPLSSRDRPPGLTCRAAVNPEEARALGRRAATFRALQAAKGIPITATEAVLHCQLFPEAGQ